MGEIDNWWWVQVEGSNLAQGDYLPGCAVPLFTPGYGVSQTPQTVKVHEYDCIVVTQSCDLENKKAQIVALCPIIPLARYEEINRTRLPHSRVFT